MTQDVRIERGKPLFVDDEQYRFVPPKTFREGMVMGPILPPIGCYGCMLLPE